MALSEQRDLRGGEPCWVADDSNTLRADPALPAEAEIIVVGAGIMGAMVADRLASLGREVVLLDRRPPGHGATAASTALVMWAADVPLTCLAERLGEREAARRWRRVYGANRALARFIDDAKLSCERMDRPELYLAGSLLDGDGLRREEAVRRAAGLPSRYLSADEVASRFGLVPKAALLSDGSYGLDPVALTLALVRRAQERGGSVHFPVDVTALDVTGPGVVLTLADGRAIRARSVVLATGYERCRRFLPSAFSILSSYAIATRPGTPPPWREQALIWEASPSYLYGRFTADGRVIAGGEDVDLDDDAQRDALIGAKARRLAERLSALTGGAALEPDCAWAASFGSSPDGLPAIGRIADTPLWLAAGFGGNGVTFAALGAEIIAAAFAGEPDPDAACFAPDRFAEGD